MNQIFEKVFDPKLIEDSFSFAETIQKYVEYVLVKKG